MKRFAWLFAFILPFLLMACGSNDDFQGRFIAPDGQTSYQFMPEGKVEIEKGGEAVATAEYQYDSGAQRITLSGETDLATDSLEVNDNGNLTAGEITLTRGIDYGMLTNSTWIGQQDQFVFALTFTPTVEGMQTKSELVTYYDDDMTYLSQIDDSITRLSGNAMFVDLTQYSVSAVTEDSFKISIGNNSMVLEKQPKGTGIEYREGYESLDEEP